MGWGFGWVECEADRWATGGSRMAWPLDRCFCLAWFHPTAWA